MKKASTRPCHSEEVAAATDEESALAVKNTRSRFVASLRAVSLSNGGSFPAQAAAPSRPGLRIIGVYLASPGGGATILPENTMGARTAITWDELLAASEEGKPWEWVDGEIQFTSPVNFSHEGAVAALIAYLFAYCRTHPEWICFASNCVFTMASGNWRMLDASLVRKNRFPAGGLPVKADFPPDVAFEI